MEEIFSMIIDGKFLRTPTDLEYAEPFYVICFWEHCGDDEGDYYSQSSHVVRRASNVLEVIDLAKEELAEEGGHGSFGVFVVVPDASEDSEYVDLIRLYGDIPDGPIRPLDTFGWTMYLDPAEATPEQMRGYCDPTDPREAHLLRVESRS